MKRLMLLLAMSCGTMSAMSVFKPHDLGDVQLAHDGSRFKVIKDQTMIDVQPAFVDKELRGLSNEKLSGLLKSGAYLKLSKFENSDEYSVRLGQRLNGGGAAGAAAGFWFGAVMTNVVGHGVIWVASLVAGPAAPGVATGASYALAAPIMAASKGVGVACGIIGGILTGPV